MTQFQDDTLEEKGLRHLAESLTGDPFVAEDLLQEARIRALENPSTVSGYRFLWMRRVIRNLAFNHHRDERRRRRRELEYQLLHGSQGTDPVNEPGLTPDRLRVLLQTLDAKYQEILRLRFLEQLPVKEVARRLQMPVETVRTRQRRALHMLRCKADRTRRRALGGGGFLPVLWQRMRVWLRPTGIPAVSTAGVLCIGLLTVWSEDAPRIEADGPARVSRPLKDAGPAVPGLTVAEVHPVSEITPVPTDRLPDRSRLSVRVLENATGDPIQGVTVELRHVVADGTRAEVRRLVTSADGRGSEDDLLPGYWDALPSNGVRRQLFLLPGDNQVTLQATAGIRVTGQVVMFERPVVGAQIWATFPGSRDVASAITKTDAEGAFQVDGVDPESWIYALTEDNCSPYMVRVGSQKAMRAGQAQILLTMLPSDVARGVVTDHRGKPVEGARVFYRPPAKRPKLDADGHRVTWCPSPRAVTDSQGWFELPRLASEQNTVWVDAGPRGGAVVGLGDYRRSQPPLHVSLAAPRCLTGVVRDAGGRLLPGAIVRLEQDAREPKWTRTDSRGCFEVPGLSDAPCVVRSWLPGAAHPSSGIRYEAGPPAAPLDITLSPQHTVRGKVVDADGNPLTGWTVRLFDRSGGQVTIFQNHPAIRTTCTGPDGGFVFAGCERTPHLLFVFDPNSTSSQPREHCWATLGEAMTVTVTDTTLPSCRIAGSIAEVPAVSLVDSVVSFLLLGTRCLVESSVDPITRTFDSPPLRPGNYLILFRAQGLEPVSDIHSVREGQVLRLDNFPVPEPGILQLQIEGSEEVELHRVSVTVESRDVVLTVKPGASTQTLRYRGDGTLECVLMPGPVHLGVWPKVFGIQRHRLEIESGGLHRYKLRFLVDGQQVLEPVQAD